MAAALSVRTATGSVVKAKTVTHIDVTGASSNTALGVERRYYILADAPAGTDDMRSHVFSPSHDGKHTWNDVIFPQSGVWSIKLKDVLDDSTVATQALTVLAS